MPLKPVSFIFKPSYVRKPIPAIGNHFVSITIGSSYLTLLSDNYTRFRHLIRYIGCWKGSAYWEKSAYGLFLYK